MQNLCVKRFSLALFVAVAVLSPVFAKSQAPAGTAKKPLDVIYVPTPLEVVSEMLKVAGVKPGDVVYDLGSGDRRIVISAVKDFGATRGVGIDLDPARTAEATANAKAAGVADRVTFLTQDLFASDFNAASVVAVYLLPQLLQRLMPKLRALTPGTRIVSHNYDMGAGWPPDRTIFESDSLIHFWRVPQQVALPPPFPRANATKLLDTDRITVWDIVWPRGQPTAMHRHVYDQVGTYYASGGRLITTPDGRARAIVTEVGSLSTTRKGTTHIEEGNTDPPLRAVFIELKRETPSGLPDADVGGSAPFPRDGAKQVLDDDRVTAWDYTWGSGSQGLRYRPARETVIVWLGAGKVRVTPPSGAATERDVNAGAMHHLTAGSNETVEIVSGSPRAILFQLK